MALGCFRALCTDRAHFSLLRWELKFKSATHMSNMELCRARKPRGRHVTVTECVARRTNVPDRLVLASTENCYVRREGVLKSSENAPDAYAQKC
jgi:hypothetical protein